LVLLQYVQRICTKTPTLDSRFVTCNSFLQTGTSSFSTSGTGVGIQTSESALRACCLPGTQCPVCPSLPRVRRSDIRNSQAPSLLTKRSRVRNLFGEANKSHFEILSAFWLTQQRYLRGKWAISPGGRPLSDMATSAADLPRSARHRLWKGKLSQSPSTNARLVNAPEPRGGVTASRTIRSWHGGAQLRVRVASLDEDITEAGDPGRCRLASRGRGEISLYLPAPFLTVPPWVLAR